MKRDKTLIFQCLLSVVFVAFAALAALALLASARLSQQSKVETLEASRNPVADHAEWNQFYDAVSERRFFELGRPSEVAQPADAAPEKRATGDVASVPATTPMSAEQAPSTSIAPVATTTSPAMPHSTSSEPAAKTDAPSTQTAVLPDRSHEKADNAAVPAEPSRHQEQREAVPSVAVAERTPPAVVNPLATAPLPANDANADKSTQVMTSTAAPPASTPRAKVATPVPPVRSAARVKQAAPQSEREPERSRPTTPPRARVALPKQRPAPQPGGSQWVDPQHFGPPQHQSGALSYAPRQDSVQPPGGPQFGPYFPYGSSPPSTQRSRAQQVRSPQQFDAPRYNSRQPTPHQMAPRPPAQSYNNPYGWR